MIDYIVGRAKDRPKNMIEELIISTNDSQSILHHSAQ